MSYHESGLQFLKIAEKHLIVRIYTTFCSSIHQLMGIWAVSTFLAVMTKLL